MGVSRKAENRHNRYTGSALYYVLIHQTVPMATKILCCITFWCFVVGGKRKLWTLVVIMALLYTVDKRMIWTNDGLDFWRLYASLDISEKALRLCGLDVSVSRVPIGSGYFGSTVRWQVINQNCVTANCTDHYKQISVISQSLYMNFLPTNCIWIRRLPNVGHFVYTSICSFLAA